ncbi:alpha/beta hydrolase [Chryseobacterium sp.]|uniref:alpha/beta fold hydrolase n=1 Tax=Chryseobacterium sp. TaxID=1871047 RepID=UPI0025BC8EB0|nr:alpha/beta hydrolase [Chryseobacterium sp.]MBV8325014.1 alpha/beta hydrolase [Chryseobacterium sp.]
MKQEAVFISDDSQKQVIRQYDHSLADFNGNIQQRIINTNFGETHVLGYGDPAKPKLVLLHGANSNATSWLKDFPVYSKNYMIYAVDCMGEPGKSDANRLPYDGEDYADWLNEVFQELKVETADIVGLSQGGWIAVKFAVKYSGKAGKLILLSPAGIVPTSGSFIFKAVLYSLLGKYGKNKINQLIIGNQKPDQSVLDFMSLMQQSVNSRMDKEYIFSDDELKKITNPTLFIGGKYDVIRDSEKIETRLRHLLPDVESFIDSEKGHVLIGLADKITAFLSGSE